MILVLWWATTCTGTVTAAITKRRAKKTVPAIETGFHTFGLLWTEKEYVFYVDNREIWRTATAVSQTEEYLLLSLELTGWGGDPALATLPDDVAFDYVRVYQKK
jgi:beta-glucanase (GH16 family)